MLTSQQTFLFLAVFALSVKAVLVGNINVPDCAIPVIIQFGPATGCAIVPSPDIPCLCNDGSFLKNVKNGLPNSCSAAQASALGNELQSRCDAVTGDNAPAPMPAPAPAPKPSETEPATKTTVTATTSTPSMASASVLSTPQPTANSAKETVGFATIMRSSFSSVAASSVAPSSGPTTSPAPLTYQSGAGGVGESKVRFVVALAVVGLIGVGTGFLCI